jgi:hypothetical protein
MAKKTLVYWRDIPAQIIVQKGRKREKLMLSDRFQNAIDRAAMRAGKGSSDAYLSEWRRETFAVELTHDAKALIAAEAQRFEDEYSDERLLQLIRNHGAEGE